MKKLLFTFIIISTFFSSKAQFFEKDLNFVSAGYGLGLGYGRLLNAYQGYDGYKFSGFGPVALTFERAVTDNIGIGLQLGYSSYGGTWNQSSYLGSTYDYKYKWSTLSIMARGAYHFNVRNRNFDPYIGAGIGYRKYSYKYTSTDPTFNSTSNNISLGIPLAYQLFVGARYMFNDNFGAYVEAGYGLSVLNAGITLSF
jgi:outer membrane protein W